MYVPGHFALDSAAAWQIVHDHGAGFLVVSTLNGMKTVYAPVIADEQGNEIRAHVARANPWWSSARNGDDVVVLFSVASAYVSPNLYPTKHESPAVVPTWNYVAVHIEGSVTIRDDREWKDALVREMTDRFEQSQVQPWSVDDAPAPHIEKRLAAIVGIQIAVTSITASAKLSQNQPDNNYEAVRAQFAEGSESQKQVAAWMNRERV
jgi:transcriptional regulator